MATAKEVSGVIEDWSANVVDPDEPEYDERFDDYGSVWDTLCYEKGTANVPGLGEIEVVDSHSGDGDGSETWVVFKVGDQLFRKTGAYSSWDSNYWDGSIVEVEPYQEVCTFYRRIN